VIPREFSAYRSPATPPVCARPDLPARPQDPLVVSRALLHPVEAFLYAEHELGDVIATQSGRSLAARRLPVVISEVYTTQVIYSGQPPIPVPTATGHHQPF
jgi:hypothetical protein